MPAIPASYQVDFTGYRRDLVADGLALLLEQHVDKCVLRQFLAALLEEVQDLHDALIDLQEQRTLYLAVGENLDALGRIVGEDRIPYQYDDSRWMFADRVAQRPDQAMSWVDGAPLESFLPVDDGQYRYNILGKILKNHVIFTSVPELQTIIRHYSSFQVSFEKTGPMEVAITIPDDATPTLIGLLTKNEDTPLCDTVFKIPYPATLYISAINYHSPVPWFTADRDDQQCDHAPCAVTAQI